MRKVLFTNHDRIYYNIVSVIKNCLRQGGQLKTDFERSINEGNE